MHQKSLSTWLKVILLGAAVCVVVIFIYLMPRVGQQLFDDQGGQFAPGYWPWMVLIWVSALPCCAALAFGWLIAVNIGHDRSYSLENARLLRWISALAAGDSAFLFLGSILYLLLNLSTPVATLISILVVFLGAAASVTAAALSHLVFKEASKDAE